MIMIIEDYDGDQKQGASSGTATARNENCPGLSCHCATSLPSNYDDHNDADDQNVHVFVHLSQFLIKTFGRKNNFWTK